MRLAILTVTGARAQSPRMATNPEPFVYFNAIPGHAVARFGSSQFIGCRANPGTGKLEWSEEPAKISIAEHARYRREYDNAVRRGELRGPFKTEAEARAAKAPKPVDSAARQGPDPTGAPPSSKGGAGKPD